MNIFQLLVSKEFWLIFWVKRTWIIEPNCECKISSNNQYSIFWVLSAHNLSRVCHLLSTLKTFYGYLGSQLLAKHNKYIPISNIFMEYLDPVHFDVIDYFKNCMKCQTTDCACPHIIIKSNMRRTTNNLQCARLFQIGWKNSLIVYNDIK